jgi:hypothetical protein
MPIGFPLGHNYSGRIKQDLLMMQMRRCTETQRRSVKTFSRGCPKSRSQSRSVNSALP